MGWFTTIYPVRLELSNLDIADAWAGGASLGIAVKAVKEQLRNIPDKGYGFGLLRYINAATAKELKILPVPQIGFNYLGRFDAPEATDWFPSADADAIGFEGPDNVPLAHGLEISALARNLPSGPQLSANFTWAKGLVEGEDMSDLLLSWFHALETLVRHAIRPSAGGLTPSDVRLVSLQQQEIDELEQMFSQLQ